MCGGIVAPLPLVAGSGEDLLTSSQDGPDGNIPPLEASLRLLESKAHHPRVPVFVVPAHEPNLSREQTGVDVNV
jgi:hypothetical protein